ncbi:MAG: hypothetical protein AB7G11_02355 [Phycisphaerales bacterium]
MSNELTSDADKPELAFLVLEEKCFVCFGKGYHYYANSRCNYCKGSGFKATKAGAAILSLIRHNICWLIHGDD